MIKNILENTFNGNNLKVKLKLDKSIIIEISLKKNIMEP